MNTDSSFPKVNPGKLTGEKGVTILKKIVEFELGWLYRENHLETDFGIDGYIDIITDSGQVTGKSIAFQLKSGESYFNDQNEIGIIFHGDKKHLNYYQNTDIPVVIIVLDINEEKAYWQVFDITKTERSGENWKMTIPRKNTLSTDSKEKLLKFIGPVTDYVSQMENEWKLNEIFKRGSNRIIFRIPKDEVVNCRFDFITSALDRIQNTTDLILHLKNKVDISFDDYDDDPNELYEIQVVKDWIVELFKRTNCWPYLFAMDKASGFMKLALFSHIPILRKTIVNGRYKIEYETQYAANFLEKLYGMLNEYCEEKGLSLKTNEEISELIFKHLFEEND